jgi:hypothetical protein
VFLPIAYAHQYVKVAILTWGRAVTIFTISLLKDGNCALVESSVSGDVSAPVTLRRSALEDYFRGTDLVRGTLEQALKDLDRIGIVEFTTF